MKFPFNQDKKGEIMCSTCNYKDFEEIDGKLEQSLGNGRLLIRCDLGGKNYKLAVKGEPKSEYTAYRCPTCGCKLY